MSNKNLIKSSGREEDKRPLPLIVAEQWGFPLQYYIVEHVSYYAVQDWIAGLASTDALQASRMWTDFQRRGTIQTTDSIRSLPYLASDNKKYERDFATDKGLYLIAQHLRSTEKRPLLKAIKQYLADAGAFVDLVRRKPEILIESGAIDPDEVIDAAIEEYRRQGKDDDWISMRMVGKVKRHMFTAALAAAINQIQDWQYAVATNQVYEGLWGRTAAILKQDLNLPSRGISLRDHQPALALAYQSIAEEVSAKQLGKRDELEWEEARVIVREVADLIGIQAKATSQYLGVDLATGKPLLPSGE